VPPPRAAPPAAAAPRPVPLTAELMLLEEASASARRGEFERTLTLLDVHERRFPTGALAEEAEVLRIGALFGAGSRATGAARARRFLERSGDGVLAGRVQAMLSNEMSARAGVNQRSP